MCKKKVIEISCLEEFIKVIHSIRTKDNDEYFYRGQSNENYKLIPSICHRINDNTDKTYLSLESTLIKEALFKYPNAFGKYDSHIDLLTQLQHYGIPTRLMDVTANPLVALYFACVSNNDKNGEVFAFRMAPEDTFDNEAIEALASVGYLNAFYNVKFIKHLKECGVELKLSPNTHTSNYERIIVNSQFPILLRQKSSFERQKAQSGYYLLFSNDLEYIDSPEFSDFKDSDIESYFEGYYFTDKIKPIDKNDETVDIIKVVASSKAYIVSQLKALNIDEAALFPEDIDRGCRVIVNDISHKYLNLIGES